MSKTSNSGSVFTFVAVGFITIAVGLLGIGLFRQLGEPSVVLPEAEAPPQDISTLEPFEFELDDPQVQYFYIDWERGINSAKKWGQIPHDARGFVTVVTPDNANINVNYVTDLWSAKNGRAVAKPIATNDYAKMAHQVASASFWATNSETIAIEMTLDIETDRIRGKKGKKRSAPRIRRLNKYPRFSIPGVGR